MHTRHFDEWLAYALTFKPVLCVDFCFVFLVISLIVKNGCEVDHR